MIVVDVYVPSVDKTYNFSLNESVKISTVISEIAEMIEQKERVSLVGNRDQLELYTYQNQDVLSNNNTLEECNVRNGNKLIMV